MHSGIHRQCKLIGGEGGGGNLNGLREKASSTNESLKLNKKLKENVIGYPKIVMCGNESSVRCQDFFSSS